MPYGTGPLIRQALLRATPWQRYLIGVVMVAGGIGLMVLGHLAGGALSMAGVALLWRMIRSGLRRGGPMHEPAPEPDRT